MSRITRIERKTKETDISLELDCDKRDHISIETPVHFFNHMLHAMFFHGGFGVKLQATGDVEIDFHHLVEDTGIVIGEGLAKLVPEFGPVTRFGHSVIPMDEALSEVTIDAASRPYLVYTADYPQDYSGSFPMALIREFLLALTNSAKINLHAHCRYGENSHHMSEALFKALGKALFSAFSPSKGEIESTKGVL